jgi:hypothetical protein
MAGGVLALLALSWTGTRAEAGLVYRGWGLRAGLTGDPDQFIVGGQLQLGEFIENLRFEPNATIGFGDHRTLIALSPDVFYTFPVEGLGDLYAGGLLTFEWVKLDLHPARDIYGHRFDDTDTDLGIHLLGGLELASTPMFFELNLGLDDAPDVKLAVGYNFLKGQ